MRIIGIDDTDSRTEGMCTTYVGHQIAASLEQSGHSVHRVLLVRLNPAAKHKTRGNAAVAIHTDAPRSECFDTAISRVTDLAAMDDDMTNPAVVVANTSPVQFSRFTRTVLRELVPIDMARHLIRRYDVDCEYWGNGRGRIGAVAAIGAWEALDDWTYEYISYREERAWGTKRDVDYETVFEVANETYPDTWDTVDRGINGAVCVPNTPCPILHGIRGDSEDAVLEAVRGIDSEPVSSGRLFVTNQGTDAHIWPGIRSIQGIEENSSYKVRGVVSESPETREGGHVFFTLKDATGVVECAAFEPTKRFRDKVRDLREGDYISVVGEYEGGLMKMEKFAVHDLNTTTLETPECFKCGNKMESAGADQGYRCRDCGTSKPSKVETTVPRMLESGWYEVPPSARRHLSKPLIRQETELPKHPEN